MNKKCCRIFPEYIAHIASDEFFALHLCNLHNIVHSDLQFDSCCVVDSYLSLVPDADHFSLEPLNHSYFPTILMVALHPEFATDKIVQDWSSSIQMAKSKQSNVHMQRKNSTWTLYRLFELMLDFSSTILWYSSLSIWHNLIIVNILHKSWISSSKLHELIMK